MVHEGFVYVKKKNLANGVISYECELRRNKRECRAKIEVAGNHVIGQRGTHTNAPDIGRPGALKIRQAMKRRALDTEEEPQQVMSQQLVDVTEEVAVKLPAPRTMKRAIRRQRQAAGNAPTVPRSRADLVLPEQYQQTTRREPFLQFDSGADDQRILLFSTQENLNLLETANDWFADGTFKVVPELFFQLFTVHGLINNQIFPCIYALLPNKTQETYARLFREITRLRPGLSPQSVMIDYEAASRRALTMVFPDAAIKGCFYHLSQSVYRNVQNHGLKEAYSNDPDLSLKIRMLPAIAFVPVEDTARAFDDVVDVMPEEAIPISNYFEDTYIGRRLRDARRNPLFSPNMWNVRERIENGLPRTNNIEGWHRRMQSNISACHPTIWKFLEVLKREQAANEVQYRAVNERLANVVADYPNRGMIDYLPAIAHNIQL